jgi:hypothetical protein
MGVSVARVSQIESGDVSTQDVLSRFVAALGGTLKLIADFGDEQLKLASRVRRREADLSLEDARVVEGGEAVAARRAPGRAAGRLRDRQAGMGRQLG